VIETHLNLHSVANISNLGVANTHNNVEAASQTNDRRIQGLVAYIAEGTFRNMIEAFTRKIVWVWNTSVDSLNAEAIIVTGIFSCIVATFGLIPAIQSGAVYIFVKYVTKVWKDLGLQENIDRLDRELRNSRARNDELLEQRRINLSDMERTRWERDGLRERLERSNQDLIQARLEWDNIVLQRAPLIIERDGLLEQNQRLQDTNAEMSRQRAEEQNHNLRLVEEHELAVREKKEAEEARLNQLGEYKRAIQEAEVYRVRLGHSQDYKEFNEILQEFHELYLQKCDKQDEENPGATYSGLRKLVPLYKTHRDKLHEMLDVIIQKMDKNDEARVLLGGILDISKSEMEHLERIIKIFHLNEELRKSIGWHPSGSDNLFEYAE